ncbi:hypothetical protein DIS24_g9593 [Lasiodiplodia hormozganensis]|uniref:Uncharacterized protein n=1 Tax=Lasiodiplodia hormozganensis TaxID=869390 RepID=A0AA39XV64_9PEZI|nr:hypothetical protein DIS24_g9593 [Lasiodiplodia hormozganensis]
MTAQTQSKIVYLGVCGGTSSSEDRRSGDIHVSQEKPYVDHWDDDAVIIDGLLGATIQWDSFEPFVKSRDIDGKRKCARFWLWPTSIFFVSPYLLRVGYGGESRAAQARFFGFEGYMPIEDIERALLGGATGSLSWSPFSSNLSRHTANQYDECIGVDPVRADPAVRELVDRAKNAGPGDQRVFTLVDTGSMFVILFQAARPPVGLLLCGSEGGMQRLVGVSYEWWTKTCYRETVLRLPVTVKDRMSRVSRLKLGLRRNAKVTRVESRTDS